MEMDNDGEASPAPSWADDWDPEEFMKLANARFPQSATPSKLAESLIPKIETLPKKKNGLEKETAKETKKKDDQVVRKKSIGSDCHSWRSRLKEVKQQEFTIETKVEKKSEQSINNEQLANERFDGVSFMIATMFSGSKVQEYCYSTCYKDTGDESDLKSESRPPLVNKEIISQKRSSSSSYQSKRSSSCHPPSPPRGHYVRKIDPYGFEIWTFKQSSNTSDITNSNDKVVYEKRIDKDGFEIWLPKK